MMERVHDRDTLQCRIKVKELRSAYCKARDTNGRSGAPPTTCRFYKELDAILGVNPTSTPSTTMDTSEPGWGGRRRRKTGVMVVGWMETPRNPWSHAARSSSQARRKVASRSGRYLVEDKQKSSSINLETSAVPLIACSETAKTQEETTKKQRRHAARSDASIY
ncbi:uncharacterized protein LOC128848859 isoform X2 [Malaclemys terrapin pileata]|uniref:uncharacterized protein LOC128848859 isoform X2 n=1 Tax=Malaclemys terrapin pileata TaxID=2991368 RepID=UPI0023A7CF7F|nr:uncharacterized protein LOC128848859 isoform X2 [Malaclemys terrapin pileata]